MRSVLPGMHLAALLCMSATLATAALAQTITPKFSWPANGTAALATTGWTSMRGGPQDDSSAFVAEGRLSSTSHAEGWLITNGPARILEGSMLQAGGLEALQAVVTRHVVSPDGKFLRLEDTLALRQHVDSAAQALLAQVPPQMREAMAGMFSLQSLRAQSELQWAQLVGSYASRTWTVGDSVLGTEQQAMPQLTGGIDVQTASVYEGEVACPASRAAATCWRFRTRRTIGAEVMEKATRAMMKLGGMTDEMMAEIPLPRSTTETVALLVVDANGFIPLESGMSMNSSTSMAMPDGTSMKLQQRMETTTRYVWR